MRRKTDQRLKPSKGKKPISQKQLDARRQNIVKAQQARMNKRYRISRKDLEAKTIDIPPVVVSGNDNGFYMMLDLNDYESLKEVLHNCALAGLSLTRVSTILETTEAIRNIGSAIGEVCLEGLSQLKNAKIVKKPGRKSYAKKNETTSKNTT